MPTPRRQFKRSLKLPPSSVETSQKKKKKKKKKYKNKSWVRYETYGDGWIDMKSHPVMLGDSCILWRWLDWHESTTCSNNVIIPKVSTERALFQVPVTFPVVNSDFQTLCMWLCNTWRSSWNVSPQGPLLVSLRQGIVNSALLDLLDKRQKLWRPQWNYSS